MNSRCEKILKILVDAKDPTTASSLAEKMGVSRQVIVGDIALLRAAGHEITATYRGYILHEDSGEPSFLYVGILACRHNLEQMQDELYTIVDYGGTVIDVAIEHAVYGEISGALNLSSRFDVDQFIWKVEEDDNSTPISSLTGGIHIHHIGCKSKEIFDRIKEALIEKQIALN
ncbi:MAG: transcription repressor NadR [Eubacteriales bacterium]|nr:transcription repressor NadR [Eubacteriales bacterium]